ncbi:rhamnogalacturonan lyase [Caudoviricetes sp.]|nr:rhamnogalacturonan lyase [Caudoviricetes sp.]
MPISSTIRRMEKGIRVNADGLLTDEHGNSIAGVGARSITKNAYYVDAADGLDSNNGDANSPWKTIGFAARNAATGSTIYVLPGTYTDAITRDGVIWDFALGAVVAVSGQTVYPINPVTGDLLLGFENLVIRGQGVFTGDTFIDGGGYYWNSVSVQAKAIYGSIFIGYNTYSQERAVWKFCDIYFGINNSAGITIDDSASVSSPTPDIQFHNCRFYTTKVYCSTPYVVTNCISRIAQDADTNEIGSYLIYANMAEQQAPA